MDINLCWDPGIFQILGIKFSIDITQITSINCEGTLTEIRRILNSCQGRRSGGVIVIVKKKSNNEILERIDVACDSVIVPTLSGTLLGTEEGCLYL